MLDTNVFISSLFGERSKEVVELWRAGEVILCLSEALLSEYQKVLKGFPVAQEKTQDVLSLIEERSHIEFVHPSRRLRVIKEDPADNKFLECAVEAGADYIITADKHLLELREFEGIPILPPRSFLQKLRANL